MNDVNDSKDLFLRMNIIGPPRSYQPNTEPTKDDVIFCNADFVVGFSEKFLKSKNCGFLKLLLKPDSVIQKLGALVFCLRGRCH